MSDQYVLVQFGDDPFNTRFTDLEGRAGFTITQAGLDPNLIIRITREAAWAQQHPRIMGPDNSYLYFGPQTTPGFIVYGNNLTNVPMTSLLRQKRDTSISRYFTGQNGKEYKWRISPAKMECMDGRSCIAVWEFSPPEEDYHALITIKPAGLAIVTEILTTLTLNRMAKSLNW